MANLETVKHKLQLAFYSESHFGQSAGQRCDSNSDRYSLQQSIIQQLQRIAKISSQRSLQRSHLNRVHVISQRRSVKACTQIKPSTCNFAAAVSQGVCAECNKNFNCEMLQPITAEEFEPLSCYWQLLQSTVRLAFDSFTFARSSFRQFHCHGLSL